MILQKYLINFDMNEIKQNLISGSLLSIARDRLNDGKWRVILKGQTSPRTHVEAGIPQGSNLGSLLMLICITGFSDNLASSPVCWR